jgi:hypothetical protein
MKVSELIAFLQLCSGDAEVVTPDGLPIITASTDGEFVYLSDYNGEEGDEGEVIDPVLPTWNGRYYE